MTMPRYGLYFTTPSDVPLSASAVSWLGYDAWSGNAVSHAPSTGIPDERLRAITAAPRKYGFHATLKAPFRLAPDHDEGSLLDAMEMFAEKHTSVVIDRIECRWIGPFLALVPDVQGKDISDLAATIVERFEPFRAPLGRAEIARRLESPLSAVQREHLDRWGYPYVFDEFRFHMTLTGALAEELRPAIDAAARRHFRPHLGKPLTVAALCVFRQDHGDAPFRVLASFPLRSAGLKAGDRFEKLAG